jgi:MinD-like ATPase involved in chromosome partitioning or flagellar assembly
MRTDLRRDDEQPGQGSAGRYLFRGGQFDGPNVQVPDRDDHEPPTAQQAVAADAATETSSNGMREPAAQVEDGAPWHSAEVQPHPAIRRSHVYTRPVVDGRVVPDNLWRRLQAMVRSLLTSNAERQEAELEQALRTHSGVTRTNTIAAVSPKGGVGKTALTFLVGNLLASHLKLRALAIDTNPDHGTLASLAPDRCRVELSLSDLLSDLDTVQSAPELSPYVARLPSGLHVLASPTNPHVMKEITPERYGDLLAFVSRYYDVVLLDLGTGITDPLPQFAIERADQVVVVSKPSFVTVEKVLGALDYLRGDQGRERLTLALNMAPPEGSGDRKAIEAAFAQQQVRSRVTIPFDQRLETMLDSGTYSLEGLDRRTRMPIKHLGLAVTRQLV